jgi:hypothetical protein
MLHFLGAISISLEAQLLTVAMHSKRKFNSIKYIGHQLLKNYQHQAKNL